MPLTVIDRIARFHLALMVDEHDRDAMIVGEDLETRNRCRVRGTSPRNSPISVRSAPELREIPRDGAETAATTSREAVSAPARILLCCRRCAYVLPRQKIVCDWITGLSDATLLF